jgi:hypothetical protein
MPGSQPEPGVERKNDGYVLDQSAGATAWKLQFSARPIPSIVHTNSKTPDNREVFDGFTFFFISQKQTVSATHRYTTTGRVSLCIHPSSFCLRVSSEQPTVTIGMYCIKAR